MAKHEMALKVYRPNYETAAASPLDPDTARSRSYSALRQTVGWIGLLLPAFLIVGHALMSGGNPFIHSLSRYYHTEMRNVFVGGLCAMALFLFHYSGSDLLERWAAALAGIFALGVAFCPVAPAGEPLGPVAWAHYGCASGLFVMLAMMSLVLFGRREGSPTPRERQRVIVHRVCGLVIVGSIVMNIHHAAAVDCDKAHCEFILWTETAALAAFGTSWLLEGRSLRSAMKETEVRAA